MVGNIAKIFQNSGLLSTPAQTGPGPAGYGLPSTIGYDGHDPRKLRKPMYTMKKRPTTRYDTTGPGPALYHPGRKTQHGNPYSPAFKMGYRFNTFCKIVV